MRRRRLLLLSRAFRFRWQSSSSSLQWIGADNLKPIKGNRCSRDIRIRINWSLWSLWHETAYCHLRSCYGESINWIAIYIYYPIRSSRLLLLTSKKGLLPLWPCQPRGIFGNGRTGSDCVFVCQLGSYGQLNTRIWSPFERFAWRILCILRTYGHRSVGRRHCLRTQRTAGMVILALVADYHLQSNRTSILC